MPVVQVGLERGGWDVFKDVVYAKITVIEKEEQNYVEYWIQWTKIRDCKQYKAGES